MADRLTKSGKLLELRIFWTISDKLAQISLDHMFARVIIIVLIAVDDICFTDHPSENVGAYVEVFLDTSRRRRRAAA